MCRYTDVVQKSDDYYRKYFYTIAMNRNRYIVNFERKNKTINNVFKKKQITGIQVKINALHLAIS